MRIKPKILALIVLPVALAGITSAHAEVTVNGGFANGSIAIAGDDYQVSGTLGQVIFGDSHQ